MVSVMLHPNVVMQYRWWIQKSIQNVVVSLAILIAASCLFSSMLSAQLKEDQGDGPALSPAESLNRFKIATGFVWRGLLSEPTIEQPLQVTFDSHGRLWVVEFRQYPEPAGLKPLSRDNFWRIVYDQIPLPPGHGGVPGADRITIHEDRDADGTYEKVSTFIEGLNIATAVVPTTDGAWVLNPPYLLFYSDADKNLVADGPPEVHLTGFGLEDTHSTVNSLCMGPDGWLYAAQGSTVTASVKRTNSNDSPSKSLGQNIWRYHPQTHQYEVFAEGGGNAYGVAMNNRGELFSGHNGGDTRGFHYYQGAYFRKGFDKHGGLSNRFALGYLPAMKHPPVQRFTHTMLMTDGTNLPSATDPKSLSMIAVDPLHGKLILTELVPNGSTYETIDRFDIVSSDDKWFRPVAITDGPDGAAYVCDWYDFQVAHLYAHEGKMDREHGRVYRLGPDEDAAPVSSNRASFASWNAKLANGHSRGSLDYLMTTLAHPIRWQRWMAMRLLAEHPLRDEARRKLFARMDANDSFSLDHLWAVHLCGWLPDTIVRSSSQSNARGLSYLEHSDPAIRQWMVRILCDDGNVDAGTLDRLIGLANSESDSKVLCQLACSAKRIASDQGLAILHTMLKRPVGESDSILPLLIWWGIEKHALEIPANHPILQDEYSLWGNPIARTTVTPNLLQRLLVHGNENIADRPNISSLVTQVLNVLNDANDASAPWKREAAQNAHRAFEAAYIGRSLATASPEVLTTLVRLGQPSVTLGLRQGSEQGVQKAIAVLLDASSPENVRVQIARISAEFANDEPYRTMLEPLLDIASRSKESTLVQAAAIASLASFNDPSVANRIVAKWPTLTPELRSTAGAVLASRSSWTSAWLDACDATLVSPNELPLEAMRAMKQYSADGLQARLDVLYPEAASLQFADIEKRTEALSALVQNGKGDPYSGKKRYNNMCARCHKLFGEGGEVGPDLTGYQRDMLSTLVRNIIGPSLEIREGFRTVQILTEDDLILTGFIESQSDQEITLRAIDGMTHTVARSKLQTVRPQLRSIMPDGLLDSLTNQEWIDLASYLRSSQPLNNR
jgi:putative heme-binding domain-containing protein